MTVLKCMSAFAVVVNVNFAVAATAADIDDLTTYATLLGRASGCGIDVQSEAQRVGSWIDRTFTGRSKANYVIVFAEGMKFAAKQQISGNSPDSCTQVRQAIRDTNWP